MSPSEDSARIECAKNLFANSVNPKHRSGRLWLVAHINQTKLEVTYLEGEDDG